ncbi:MAG: cache domain-containing protein [Acidobacteriota bacterium]
MAKTTDDGEGVKRRIVSAARAPLIITIVVIVVIGAAYYAFYRNQVDYFTGRNLRLISTVTAQIDGRVAMYSSFFREGTLKPDRHPEAAAVPQPEPILRGMEESSRGWALLLQASNGSAARVPLVEVLRPIFARRVGAAFDIVLVADARGDILYSFRTPPAASSLLTNEEEPLDKEERGLPARTAAMIRAKERESGSALVITRLSALSERKGWREYRPLDPATLLAATEQIRVRLGDDEYLLFAQPYTFARKPVSLEAGAKQLILCGLVAAPRFRYDVSAVSASIILMAVGVALLALCCWPFLRIALIHPSQELTITDVALIVICTAIGAAVLTLAVLDGFAYRTLASGADEQLHHFSETVVENFGINIQRAMKVLDRAKDLTAPLLPPADKPENISKPLPPALTATENIGEYPYIDSITWIDRFGKQQARFTAQNLVPLSDVGQRQYFRNALFDRTWTVNQQPYVLEWVRSRATGEVRAVLAKKTGNPQVPVIALSTDLIDVTYAVRPPGVELAIIDENGEVVYHSDTERIEYENFFAETDRNRDLRSAVLARHESHVTASYWGEDKSMFVRPLTGSRWTLIAFRAKRLTRVLNIEAALLTLVLLMIGAAPYVFLYIFTLIVAPRYRAPSIWPDESRRSDYLRLCIIYLGLLLLFGLTVYVLTPWSSFYAVMMIPAVAILSTYLVLHRVATPRRFAIGAALWIVANAVLFSVLLRYNVAAGRFFSGHPAAAKAVLVTVAVAVAALTAVLTSTSGGRRLARFALSRVPLGYSTLYRLCGVLILVLCAALPVAAFFNIARHVQSELLVKYGQLRAAADLEHRIDRIETLNVGSDSTPAVYRDVLRADILEKMFGSKWQLQPVVGGAPELPTCEPPDDTSSDSPAGTDWTVPPDAASLLPSLYEDSIAIRPLFNIGATDALWHWCLQEKLITLVRKVRFDVDVSQKLWPSRDTPADQKIVISSLRTPAEKDDDRGGPSALAAMLLGGLGLLVVFWYAAGFIASRVLLMDVTEPHWMARLPLSPTLGDHIFLVRRDKDAATLTGDDPMGKGLPFLDVSFEELARIDSWDTALERLDSSAAGRNVRLVDFEYGINHGAINLKKLRWLERLLSLPDRTVIVISTVSPAFVMTAPPPEADAPPDYLDRWRRLLDRFVTVTAEELELRHQEWKRRQEFRTLSQLTAGRPKSWLEKETAYNPFLRRLRDELEPGADRAHLLDEIAERAETYYAGLWASCRQDEKLLLYQLARNGLANGRNRRTLRRLIARGLVRRDPNLQLFSETFRLYVLTAAQREDLVSRARAERGTSTWDSLRLPFFIIIISFLLLLFATQKDLLTTTTALATALTTGLPIIMKLIGVFSEKRMGGPDRA